MTPKDRLDRYLTDPAAWVVSEFNEPEGETVSSEPTPKMTGTDPGLYEAYKRVWDHLGSANHDLRKAEKQRDQLAAALRALVGDEEAGVWNDEGDRRCTYCLSYLSSGDGHEIDCPIVEARRVLASLDAVD